MLKRYGEAIAPLEAARQGSPTGEAAVKAAGELAICYARSGQLDKAKKTYADLVEKNPRHPLIAPTTELLAEAAYDANDAAWSAELSAQLRRPVFDRVRVERKAGAWLEPVQGGQAARGRRDFRRSAQEKSTRGNGRRSGPGSRPDSRTARPERTRLGDVRTGDRQISD